MEEILKIILILFLVLVVSIVLTVDVGVILTKININMGPYKCIDIDGNEVICEQTWRSYGTLYGITKDGKTIDLKSYESAKE